MKKITFLALFVTLFTYTLNAQTYCQPTGTVPALAHASSQSFYSVNVTSNSNTLLSYTDAECKTAYNWLQTTQKFELQPGQQFTVEVRSGIWSWNIVLAFDWNEDGIFESESIYWAFGDKTQPSSQTNSSWGPDAAPYNESSWRTAQQATLGHRGVINHTFTITVPTDAKIGSSRMRILCDGDGYNNGGTPPLGICEKVGYAGSIHDFGVTVSAAPQEQVATPVITPVAGNYTSAQNITITSETAGAAIYYTLDDSTPTASSTLYSAPFSLSANATVKAIAIKEGMTDSDVAQAAYTFTSTGLSNLNGNKAYAYTKDGQIHVANIEAGASVAVYSIAGKLISSEIADSNSYTLRSGLSNGVYIIKAGTKTLKVVK